VIFCSVLAPGGPPVARTVAAGGSFTFTAADIHRVTHVGGAPAVSLHAYSPPLRRMGAYEVGEDGVLRRHPMSAAEELKPLTAPA
jgi:hypothetical protein